MNRSSAFYDALRAGLLGPTLSATEVTGCDAICAAMTGAPLAYTAYALATAYKETAHTMQPIDEVGGDAYFTRRYDIKGLRLDIARALGNTQPGDGVRFHGRGYVQLTGRANYARASAELGVDLIAHPDRALNPKVAADIMRRGMTEGWFTGRRFADFLPSAGGAAVAAYTRTRAIINGSDCAAEIAGYALRFEQALVAGGWA